MQSCSACSSTPICLHPNKEPSNEGTQRGLFHSCHTTALRDALSSARPVVRSGQLPGRHQNNPHYSSCHKTLRVYSLLEQNLRAVSSIGLQPQQSASGLRALQHLNALAVLEGASSPMVLPLPHRSAHPMLRQTERCCRVLSYPPPSSVTLSPFSPSGAPGCTAWTWKKGTDPGGEGCSGSTKLLRNPMGEDPLH